MVEANKQDAKNDEFQPSDQERVLLVKHLGNDYRVDPKFKTTVVLSKTEANTRKSLIKEIEYDYQLALQKGDYYLGNAVINFYLVRTPANDTELFINLQALAVADLTINDREGQNSQFEGQKIRLSMTNVVQGWNTVQLRYMNPYNKNRVGLHTFTDAKDQQQYLYSQFEAFHCFRVFPCFDQPNLKAKMSLTVLCPQDWQAVSNGIEKRYENCNEGEFNESLPTVERAEIDWMFDFYDDRGHVAVCEFEQTPKISTYLYAICAGPYRVFKDYDPMYVPQRIFVRQSLVENLRHELVFGVTKTTLNFYQTNFGTRYPFTKVDHVMSPDYKYGAMENVGCITYSDEIMCSQKDMSIPQLTFFCVVIQHELCHMWFGNLVTMKWWEDLWLNEAFATALSYKACSEGGEFVDQFKDESWLHMSGYKRWGLGEDLSPANHKIQADCPTTDTAESLIDGITYGKGSSMIKQLIYLMGWTTFCKGLKHYFQTHSWSNTELSDFFASMQTGLSDDKPNSDLNLTNWGNQWLQTKGCNRLSVEAETEDGKYTSFKIRQGHCKNSDEIFREQTINMSGYNDSGNLQFCQYLVKIEKKELSEVKEMIGKEVPAALLLNSEDWGYGYFVMDDGTMKVFENSLAKLDSSINRAVVIGQLIAMMRQIEYPATRMPKIMNQLMSENNQNLINALANAFLLAKNTYLPPETVPKFNKETADFFLEKAQKDKDQESLLKFCINTALNFTKGSTHLELVASWITTGQVKVNDEVLPMTLDPKQKYEILKSYWASSQFTLDQKKELRDKALESDDSDAAIQIRKVLDWILPDADLKKRLWEDITESQSKESLMDLRLKMQGFMAGREQKDLILPYSEKYYAILKKVVDTRDREFAEAFMNNLSPAFMAREQDESAFRELLNRTTDDTHFFTIFLKKQVELIEIIKKSRQLCETFKID